MSSPSDFQRIKDQQRQGWDSVAEGWKSWWRPIEQYAQVVSDKIVELAEIRQGQKVLDIGTGIGEPSVTAARRVQPDGKVVAIDLSPQMIEIAKERAKENGLERLIEFKVADGESLSSFADSNFDAIVSRWGFMFLPNLSGALAAMRGALVPGGRIATAVWSTPDKVPFLSLAISTAMKQVEASPPPPGTPGPFSLADTNMVQEKFRQAGFSDVKVHTGSMNFEASSPEEFTKFHQAINAPIKLMISKQSPQRQTEIWNAITDAVRKHQDPKSGALTLQNEVIYIAAIR